MFPKSKQQQREKFMKTTGNFQIKIKLSGRGDRKKLNKATGSYEDKQKDPEPEVLSSK